MSFPTKEERTKCWATRDEYWQCLDKYAPKYTATSGEREPEACKHLRRLYEQTCPSQWVKHFDRKRSYEQFKEKMLKGYDPLEGKTRSGPKETNAK